METIYSVFRWVDVGELKYEKVDDNLTYEEAMKKYGRDLSCAILPKGMLR